MTRKLANFLSSEHRLRNQKWLSAIPTKLSIPAVFIPIPYQIHFEPRNPSDKQKPRLLKTLLSFLDPLLLSAFNNFANHLLSKRVCSL